MDHKWEDCAPPLARVMGVGIQQQVSLELFDFQLSNGSLNKKNDAVTLVIETKPILRRTISSLCIPLCGILLLITMIVGGIYMYKLLTHRVSTSEMRFNGNFIKYMFSILYKCSDDYGPLT